MSHQNFLKLEIAVMDALLSGHDPKLEILRQQFKAADLKERKLTGVGFYVNFLVPDNSLKLDAKENINLNDVIAQVDGVKEGIGFDLFIRDGVIEMLEGFTYDEPWPPKVDNFQLSYLTGAKLEPSSKRDMVLLKQKLLYN